jgi:AbrB family looped-hinge helix DNA binding protein
VIPKPIAALVGIKKGDRVVVEIRDGALVVTRKTRKVRA